MYLVVVLRPEPAGTADTLPLLGAYDSKASSRPPLSSEEEEKQITVSLVVSRVRVVSADVLCLSASNADKVWR